MSSVDFPALLTASNWERAVASARPAPAVIGDGLKSLKRLYDAIDFSVFDVAAVKTLAAANARLAEIETAAERRVKPFDSQARSVGKAADKWLVELKKRRPSPAPLIAAAGAVGRGAETVADEIGALATSARIALARRRAELEAGAKAEETERGQQSQHRLRLKKFVVDGFRIVKNRPDVEVSFLICRGHRTCFAYLGRSIGASQRALLKNAATGDAGLKFYKGRCVYEESCYVFAGPALPSGLRPLLERGLHELTGSNWRVRVRATAAQPAPQPKG